MMVKKRKAPKVHPQALEALKRYRADVRAGHTKAAEFWKGAAGAYLTANPGGLRALNAAIERVKAQGYRGVGHSVDTPHHLDLGKRFREQGYQVRYVTVYKAKYGSSKIGVYVKAPYSDNTPEKIFTDFDEKYGGWANPQKHWGKRNPLLDYFIFGGGLAAGATLTKHLLERKKKKGNPMTMSTGTHIYTTEREAVAKVREADKAGWLASLHRARDASTGKSVYIVKVWRRGGALPPNPTKGKLITLKQWDAASTEQRQKWLDEGRGLTMAAGRALYRRVKQGRKILNPLRPRLTPYKGKRLPRRNPFKSSGEVIVYLSGPEAEEFDPDGIGFLVNARTGKATNRWADGTVGIPKDAIPFIEEVTEAFDPKTNKVLEWKRNPAYAYGPTGYRPPKRWWNMVMASARAQYRRPKAMSLKKYREALAKVVGGVWAKFPQKTRDAILRKYEGK